MICMPSQRNWIWASVQGGNWTANQMSAITVILITVLILFCETTFIWLLFYQCYMHYDTCTIDVCSKGINICAFKQEWMNFIITVSNWNRVWVCVSVCLTELLHKSWTCYWTIRLGPICYIFLFCNYYNFGQCWHTDPHTDTDYLES